MDRQDESTKCLIILGGHFESKIFTNLSSILTLHMIGDSTRQNFHWFDHLLKIQE